jgi:hypothetical protein
MENGFSNFNPEDGILYTRPNPVVAIDDMRNGIQMLVASTSLPRDLKILEDARESTITFQASDLPALSRQLERILGLYSSVRHAVVLSNPLNTALAMLIGSKANNDKYQLRVFSTPDAARSWLLSELK